MAAKAELDRLEVWKNRVGWARKFRDPFLAEYNSYKRYFVGDQFDTLKETSIESAGAIVINLIFSHIKATLPMMYFQNPKFYLDATRMEFEQRKDIAEEVLNYIVRREKLKREIRLSTLDALFLIGIAKTGYNPVFKDNANKGKEVILGNDENGNNIYVTDPMTGEIISEPDELLVNEEFFTKRVSPKNMLFDPQNKNFIEDHDWVGEEVIVRLDDAKKNQLFKHRDRLKETHYATEEVFVDPASKDDELKEDLARVRLVHLYDLRDNVFRIYAEGQEEDIGFLYEDDTPEGIDRHPYSILKFHDVPDEFFPLPEIKILKPIQDEFNKMINILGSHAKKFLRKYGYETGAFVDDDQKEMFKEPVDGMLVEFNKNMLEKIKPIDDATQDPATDNYLNRLMINFWQTAGRTEAERGNVERRKTMFESSQIEKYGQLRTSDAMSLVEDFAKDIGKRKLDQIQANLTLPLSVKIGGKIGQYWEEGLTKTEIVGDYDVTIDIGSTGPKIPEIERQQLETFIDKISNIPNIEQILVMPMDEGLFVGDLIKELGDMYDVDVEKIIKKKGANRSIGDIMSMQAMMQKGGPGQGGSARPARQRPGKRAR